MCRRQAPRPPAPPRTGTRICASSGRQEPVGRADDESCEPEDPGDEACRGSEGPLKRAIRRADTAQGARAGPDREGREDAERETEKTQDERARCGAISHRALAPSGSLPERTVAQKDVDDGADPPDEGDDDPQDLLQPAHLGAPDDVDDTQDP